MVYSLKETNKGYIISFRKNRKTVKYFLYDETHTKEKYIDYILTYGEYKIGKPFGDDIYPIYLNHKAVKKVDESLEPINIIANKYKMSAIWNYYRSSITEDSEPKVIKRCAKELKANLELLGLDGLFHFVQAQSCLYL